jgi:hypothetical protein
MIYVEFLQTYTVKDGTGTTYLQGKVYEMTRASADHFISRRRAKEIAAPGYVVPAQPKSPELEGPVVEPPRDEERNQESVDGPADVEGADRGGDRVGAVANGGPDRPRPRGRPPRTGYQR